VEAGQVVLPCGASIQCPVTQTMKKEEKERYEQLVELGCCVCWREFERYNEPQIHHPREKVGMAERGAWDEAIPLCHKHHQGGGYGIAFHAGQGIWEKTYGTEAELLTWTLERI